MIKQFVNFLVLIVALMTLCIFESQAQLNETFDGITFDVPSGWDNDDYDNLNMDAWSYYANGYNGSSAVACKAIDASTKTYAVLKTPFLQNLPADCQLTFNCNAPGQFGQMTVSLVYGVTRVNLGKVFTKGEWGEFSFDLSQYSGYSVAIEFRIDCGGRGSNASEWYILDNVKVGAKPNCAKPVDLSILSVAQDEVTFTWSMSGEGVSSPDFDLIIKDLKDNINVVSETITAEDYMYTVEGLEASTNYEIVLKTNCSASGQGLSDYITAEFSTLCASQRLPYLHNFDGWTTLPDCWLGSKSGVSVQESIKIGSSAVKLTTTTSNEAYIVSPQLNHVANDIELVLSLYGTKGTKYSILLTPNPTDLTQAIPLWENLEIQKSNEWHTLTFNTIVSTLVDKGMSVVVFMPSGVNATMYVDEFKFYDAPACPKLENLVEVISDSASTTLDWSEFIKSDKYEILMTKDSLIKEDSIVSISKSYIVTTHPYQITGLDKNTKYNVKVRAICSESEISAWSNSIVVHTSCGIRKETIFFEGFESGVFPPECWFSRQTVKATTSSGIDFGDEAWTLAMSSSGYDNIHTGNYAAKLLDSKNGTHTILVSQPIYIDVPTHYDLSLWVYRDEEYVYLPKENEGLKIWVNTRPDTIGGTKLGFISSLYTMAPIEEAPGYYQYEYNIPIAGNVYIIFEGVNGGSYGMFMDDIEVKLAPLCRKVSNVKLGDISTTTAKITWDKGLRETKWNVNYTLVSGQNEVKETVSVENTPELVLTNLSPGMQYTLTARIVSDCGSGDIGEPVLFTERFETDCDAINLLPYIQTFDEERFPPHCWRQYQSKAYGNPNDQFATDYKDEAWIRNDDKFWYPELIKSGAASAKLQTSSAGIRSALISPQFDFESGKEYVVSFWMYRLPEPKDMDNTTAVEDEGLNVFVNNQPSVDGAAKLGYINVGSQFVPKVEREGYYKYEFTISSSGKQYVIFEGVHQGTMSIYIDNVVIREKTSCDYMDVKIDSIKTTLARVTSLTSDVDKWEVSVGVPGFNPNTGSIFEAEGSNVIISGLTPQTDYELYVRRQCEDGTYGPWSEFVYQFSTQCDPLVVSFDNPFFDGFEDFIVDEYVLGCYQQEAYFSSSELFTAKTEAYNDNGVLSLEPYEGEMFAVLPFNNNTWLFRPFELKANSNYEVSVMGRQDCDYGITLSLAYFFEPDTALLVDTMTTQELVGEWKEFKGWINAPKDGTYYIGVNIALWGVSSEQSNSAIDNFTVKEIACAPPVQIQESRVTSQSAEIDFHSIADVWEVKVASVKFDPEYGVVDIAHDTIREKHYEINGLQANKEYYYSFRSLCSEPSEWSHVGTFRTVCSKFELPYYENFEDPELNSIVCWNSYLNNPKLSESKPSTTKAYDGRVAYKMYESMTILPEFNVSSLANYLVRGYLYSSKDDAYVSIGVVKDITNPLETFESVANVAVKKRGEWTEFVAYLSELAKPDYAEFVDAKHIAFVVGNETEFYLDKFEIVEIPTCLSPTEVKLLNVTANSCEIKWYENGTAKQWQVQGYYKNELVVDTIVTTNPAVISDLMPASTYEFEIRALCSDIDQSWWTNAGEITTECDVYDLPYDETFVGLEAPKCWSQGLAYPNIKGNYWVHKNGSYVYSQYFNIEESVYPADMTSMIVSPKIDLSSVTNALLSFDLYNYNCGNVKVLLSQDGGMNFDVVLGEGYANTLDTLTLHFDLTKYVGKVVCVGIEAKSSGIANSYVSIDNFSVEDVLDCVRPLDAKLIIAYDLSAKFELVDTTYNSSWEYVVGSLGFDPDKASAVSFTTKEFEVTGLSPLSNYELYVRAVCGSGNYSNWRGPISIQTSCSMDVEFPYYEGFEGISSLNDNCFRVFSFKSTDKKLPIAELSTQSYVKSYVSTGSQGLVMRSSSEDYLYVALPLFAKPLRELKISFDYRNEYSDNIDYIDVATTLELGVMDNLNIEQSYTRLVELPLTSIHGFESYFYSFADADEKYDLNDKYIVFRYNKNPNKDKSSIYAGLDNITIVPVDYCYAVEDLHVADVSETTVTFDWTHENENVLGFEYRLLSNNAEIQKGEFSGVSLDLSGLVPATDYQLELRCRCSKDNYSDWATLNFRTLAYSPTLPYFSGFEDEESLNWVYCGEGQTNYFVVGGDKLGVKSGAKALYITNDNQLNQYSIGAASSSYAYRVFDFEPGQYRISYSWKCYGEYTDAYNADYAKVYLAPVNKEILAGKRLSSYMDAVPGCIMLGDDKGLNVSYKWNDVVVDVVIEDTIKYNLVIEWYNNGYGGSQTPIAIDDISVVKVGCPKLSSVELVSVDDISARFAINTVVDSDSYEYRLCKTNDIDDVLSEGITQTKEFDFSNLIPATDYYLFVCGVCGEEGKSEYEALSFHTENPAIGIPYISDFSNDDENSQWVILNGNQKNGFVIGGETKSLYITSEPQQGSTAEYGYDSYIETAVYAYRLLDMQEGQYVISYNWKSEGSKLDYGRVFLVPASYNLEAGDRIGNVNVTTYEATLPAECISLDGGVVLAETTPQTSSVNSFFVAESGRYKLVVQWYNRGTYTGTLPLWIDDISIEQEACSDIDALDIHSVDHQSVTATFKNYNDEGNAICAISTTADVNLAFDTDTISNDTITFEGLSGNTTYYLFVKSQCYDNLESNWKMVEFRTDCSPIYVTETTPYFEGFENYTDNENLDNCWTLSYKFNNTPIYVTSKFNMSYNAYAMEGSKYLTLENGNNTANVSRKFYLERGTYYCISAWSTMSYVEDLEKGRSTLRLIDFTNSTMLAERELDYEAYREVRRVFVPQETGIYDLGFALNVGMSVVHANVDNFKVEVLKFGSPDQLEVDTLTKTSAQVSWVGIADRFQIQLYKDSELLVDTTTSDLFYGFDNLSPATTYKVLLRAVIDNPSQVSKWIETMFTTECGIALPTFEQNFETIVSGAIPVCWDNIEGTTLTDYTKNWSVRAESGNKSVIVNTSELYGLAVLTSPMIFVDENTILSYRYRNLTHTDKLKVEIMRVGVEQSSEVIYEGGHSGWQQKQYELSAYKGDTIQVVFSVEAKANKEGNVIGVDDVRVACYAGEKTDYATICQGSGFTGYGFSVSSNQLYVGVNKFSEFVTSNDCDTLKHLEITVNPTVSSHVYDTICRGDVYMWGDIPCVETNVYEVWYREASSCGCDSVAYLHLTVLDLRENIYATICEGESYKFGDDVYTETGIYVDTIANPGSCDSIKILTLVVVQSVFENYKTVCEGEPVVWNDTTLTTTGRYERIYSNVNGCDSIEVMNLTVLPTYVELNATICQGLSYLFGGKERYESGIYVDSLVNVLGCDSIITLNLNVTEPNRGIFEDYVCEGYEYVGFGFRTAPGEIVADTVLYRTIQSISGCDSIIELNLDFEPTVVVDTVVAILEGEYYDFGENSLTRPGKYSEVFVTSQGCDSIVNLTLEVITSVDNVYALPLTIAPNPITGGQVAFINKDFTAEEQKGLRVEVINSVGQIIMSDTSVSYPIAVYDLGVSGLYYVRIITGTGELYVGKLIVK